MFLPHPAIIKTNLFMKIPPKLITPVTPNTETYVIRALSGGIVQSTDTLVVMAVAYESLVVL